MFLLGLILMFILFPLGMTWSFNVLFDTNIGHSLEEWVAWWIIMAILAILMGSSKEQDTHRRKYNRRKDDP